MNCFPQLQYLREMINVYVRFQRIKIGIELIRMHHQDEPLDDRRQAVERIVNSTDHQIGRVLANLREYYSELNQGAADAIAELPEVDADIIPEENREYTFNERTLQHFVILREYMNHLKYSQELFDKFNAFTSDEEAPE